MSSGQSEYERRAARQRQLDLMEASASGVLPEMELDTSGLGPSQESGFTSVRQRNQETARRFLYDEDDIAPSHRASLNTAHAQLFSPRTGSVHRVNLMDHEAGVYADPETDEYGSSFVDALFGVKPVGELGADGVDGDIYLGDGKASGRASRTSGLCANLRKRTATGRKLRFMILGMLIFGFVVLIMLATKDDTEKNAEILHEENSERYDKILEKLTLTGISKRETFDMETSTEHDALRWVAYSDPARLDPEDPMLIQRYVLAVFYYGSYNDFVRDHGEQAPIENGDEQFEGVPVPGFHRRDYWLTEKGVCLWYGVECEERDGLTQYNADANIVSIDLSFNHVYGHIPREFKGLTSLRNLNFSGNDLKGTFPPEMGRMFRLKTMDLHGNKLTGELPKEMGFLEGMYELNLSNNKFKGTIPLDIERMYNLRKLNFDDNEFSGEFPSIKNLANIEALILSNNKFSKTIPESFTFLENLTELRLDSNEFVGPIPEGFKQLQKLKILSLQKNSLSGSLPGAIFESNKDLEQIYLEFNELTGELPDSIGELQSLITLKMNDNLIEGPIPEAWTDLKSLKEFRLQNNKLKGPLPDSLGKMPSLQELQLDHNDIDGQIPMNLGEANNLETVYLNNNGLTGEVPVELSNLSKLGTLRLEENSLIGIVPTEVCQLTTESTLSYLSIDCKEEVECDCCTCF